MIVVLGGGLAGLSAAYTLSRAGVPVRLVEKGTRVGGLARTIEHNGHRFDLGGHRFLSDNPRITALLEELLGDDLLSVPRRSSISMKGKSFEYPLRPANAMFGFGLATSSRILRDYLKEQWIGLFPHRAAVSLEDWVVRNFGRTMHELYFKEYSEKVWGIDCSAVSAEWVEQRIEGLSLGKALMNAFRTSRGKGIKTLADSFLYPRHGIGQIAERLGAALGPSVQTATEARRIFHEDGRITGVELERNGETSRVSGTDYLSSIPMTLLVSRLDPSPPTPVLRAAGRIGYRALVTATLAVGRERITDQTWIYFPERSVPFGRIHEPRNWSSAMAPPGRSHLVVEYFCNEGDAIWSADDSTITDHTIESLIRLGLLRAGEVNDYCITRVPHAYPVFSVGYRDDLEQITSYLDGFSNLSCIGRSGMFRYLNMDRAMETGIATGDALVRRRIGARSLATPGLF